MDFMRVFITAPTSIIVLFLLSKLTGNKQMSQLNLFDYINGITIGSIAAEMATGEISELPEFLLALVIYAGVVILLSVLSQKSLVLRRFFTGKSIVLYDNGKLFKKNLWTAKIDVNELLAMCRNQGYFDFDSINTIILEQSGQMSILPKEDKRPLNPSDVNVAVEQSKIQTVVILQGEILEKNLKYTGNNEEWLKKQLDANHKKQNEVFLALCDESNSLKIIETSDQNPRNDIFE